MTRSPKKGVNGLLDNLKNKDKIDKASTDMEKEPVDDSGDDNSDGQPGMQMIRRLWPKACQDL